MACPFSFFVGYHLGYGPLGDSHLLCKSLWRIFHPPPSSLQTLPAPPHMYTSRSRYRDGRTEEGPWGGRDFGTWVACWGGVYFTAKPLAVSPGSGQGKVLDEYSTLKNQVCFAVEFVRNVR